MDNEHMQTAIKELQDAMVVMAHMEKQQSEPICDLREFQHRTEQNLAEITDQLNGLSGYTEGQRPGDPSSRAASKLGGIGHW
jgi:hypothetical protein